MELSELNQEELDAIDSFSCLSLAQLRKYQRVNEQQMKIAYERQLDEAIYKLNMMQRILAAAVYKRCFINKKE